MPDKKDCDYCNFFRNNGANFCGMCGKRLNKNEDYLAIAKSIAGFPKAIRLALCAGEVFAELKQEAAKREEPETA